MTTTTLFDIQYMLNDIGIVYTIYPDITAKKITLRIDNSNKIYEFEFKSKQYLPMTLRYYELCNIRYSHTNTNNQTQTIFANKISCNGNTLTINNDNVLVKTIVLLV